MANIFAASEVVDIGIQIEKNGRDFYYLLAERAKNTKAKSIFEYLAKQEENHIVVFQKILDKTDKYQPQGLDAEQYYDYMNALARESVFTQKDKGREIAQGLKSDQEAFNIGIAAEKDSIVFYQGIKKAVPEDSQKAIEEVIAQEQAHLKQLLDLKVSL